MPSSSSCLTKAPGLALIDLKTTVLISLKPQFKKFYLLGGLWIVEKDDFFLAGLPTPSGALMYPPIPPASLFLLVLLPFIDWLTVTFLDSSSTLSPSLLTLERVL